MHMRTASRAIILNGDDGFTLVELMTVVAVIGIVVALALPDLLALSRRMQTDLFAKELASELRQARQLAITRRDRVYVVFEREQRAILAQVGRDRVLHHVFQYRDRGMEMDEPSAGSDLVFHPSGRSATATTIRLHHARGETATITVSLTGRVSIL
ncbi:GspH/FimT family protein [Nitrospira sp. NS4]|uniref:GspH/FimT family protein n=1 Tax=Nitrospira sp. NS4 TaxID=3414498 RepID=UPI003C2B98AC